MRRFVFLGFALFLGLPALAAGINNPESTPIQTVGGVTNTDTRSASQTPAGPSSQMVPAVPPETKQEAKQDTAEDKAYKAKMIKISDAIVEKIKQIQAKQKEINDEVYITSKPQLTADKVILESQLRDLEMERDKMQTIESARKMAQDLKSNKSTP